MKRNLISFTMLGIFLLALACTSGKKEWSAASPTGKIKFTFLLSDDGQLNYKVAIDKAGVNQEVIASSGLGIRRSDNAFINNLKFVGIDTSVVINETFALPVGKQKSIANHYNEVTIKLENENGVPVEVIARVYDDGVAFRYHFPGTDSVCTVEDEVSSFAIAQDGKAWIQPYDKVTMYTPAYERYFENGIAIGTAAPSKEGWAFPALFETGNSWILLTEAAVDSSYFAAHLQPAAEGRKYTIRLPEDDEAKNTCSNKPVSSLPWFTPWRVIVIGENLSDVVESNMVVKLNPPSKIDDESWIKPGRASWSWWGDWPSPKNFNSLKKFVDFSAEMGWEYTLVDANWDLMEGGNIEQLVKYANSKNIGVLMWYNSGGQHNDVTERPRDIMSDDVKRREEFKKLGEWGVKGVKVDFFQSDKPMIIKQYFDILKDAADNKVMVNFHGCTLPKGWNRTWPNLVSMEAIRGAESYAFDSIYPQNAVWHNTILPFTRNAVGSMDYTPVTFSDQRYPHLTTYGHELALSVVFESGILHLADRIEPYRKLPAEPKQFLKTVPVVWDSTILLQGYPGKECVIARRANNAWYIGGINGTDQSAKWEIDLSRLGKNDFAASIITDGATAKEFESSTTTIKSGDKMVVEVLPAGGFVAVLK